MSDAATMEGWEEKQMPYPEQSLREAQCLALREAQTKMRQAVALMKRDDDEHVRFLGGNMAGAANIIDTWLEGMEPTEHTESTETNEASDDYEG